MNAFDYATHIVLGILVGFGFDKIVDLTLYQQIIYYVFVVLGSVLPDVDMPQSFLGKFVFPIAILLNKTVGHRTLTHSILLYTILLFVFRLNIIMVGITIGAVTHILGDMLTPQRVQFLYPFKIDYKIKKSLNK